MTTPPPIATPLDRFPLFRTDDVDDARDLVARVFCPHRLAPRAGVRRVRAIHNRVETDGLSLNYLEYGAEVDIVPGTLGSFFLLQLPLTGDANVMIGRRTIEADASTATLLSPTLDVAMTWSRDCSKMLVQLSRDKVEEQLEALLDRPMTSIPLEFEPSYALDPRRSPVAQLVHLWREDVDQGTGCLAHGLLGPRLRELVVTTLLACQPHTYSKHLARPVATIAPRHVRRAEDYMSANLEHPITLAQVARAAGVSLRALQVGFQRFRGTSPSATLREMRLAAAHRDLQSGAAESVTSVALKWGFSHLGRFSIAYSARYGSMPSETHRRHLACAPATRNNAQG